MLRATDGKKLGSSEYKKPIDDTVAALRKDPDVRKATSPLATTGPGCWRRTSRSATSR